MYMTRTTGDIINDLDNAITDQDLLCDKSQIALIVGFEHECRMVFHGENDRLSKLNTLVKGGGIPLGFIKATKIGKDVSFLSRPLIEFKDDQATAELLSRLCFRLGKEAVCKENGN